MFWWPWSYKYDKQHSKVRVQFIPSFISAVILSPHCSKGKVTPWSSWVILSLNSWSVLLRNKMLSRASLNTLGIISLNQIQCGISLSGIQDKKAAIFTRILTYKCEASFRGIPLINTRPSLFHNSWLLIGKRRWVRCFIFPCFGDSYEKYFLCLDDLKIYFHNEIFQTCRQV